MSDAAKPSAMSSAGLRRGHLSLPDVIAQSVSIIAPGMSGAFLTYLAATKAGGATPLAFLLAGLGALCIGTVVSEFGKSMSSAGSLYTYVTAGWSKTMGFLVGWLYSIALIILGAAVLAGFGFFGSLLTQSLTDSETFVSWQWFMLAGLIFVAAMSLFDVKISTRAQLAFTAVSVLIMVIAALWVIKNGSPAVSVLDGTTPVAQAGKSIDFGAFWPSAAGVPWSGILFGLAFGILSFTGFEGGAVLAEETADPKRNIPKAVIGSVLVGGVFYLLITYATSIGFGVRQAAVDWPTSAAGLVAVASPISKTLANLVLFAVAVSALFCTLGVLTASSRIIFAMGREGVLPKALGRTHPTWRTPFTAIIVTLIEWVVLIYGLLLITGNATEVALGGGATDGAANLPAAARGGLYVFGYWATLATPAIMLAYLLLGIAGFRKGQSDGNSKMRTAGILAAITGALAVFGSLYYSFKEAAPGAGILTAIKIVPWITVVFVVLGLIIATFIKSSKPAAWADMGAVFDEG